MPAEWLIEIGHSRLKIAHYQSGQVGASTAVSIEQFPAWLQSHLDDGPESRPDRVWLCAVPQERVLELVLQALQQSGIEIRRVTTGAVELPVRAAYAGLGVDRWLAMQPVWQAFHSAFVLIDCGTATTIDVVDEQGHHHGGWIVPGRHAARQGLLMAAPGLKRSSAEIEPARVERPASDTLEAIESGLILQQLGCLAFALQTASQHVAHPLRVVMTGGEARPLQAALESWLKTNSQSQSALESSLENVWLEPDLVLQGLAMAAKELSSA